MITFLDPRAEPGAPVDSYDLSVDVEAAPVTVGLVANGFPDSEEFLDQVEKALLTGTVRDGVRVARRGVPAVSLVTQEFWPQGDFIARSVGLPDLPRIKLPHPVAGTGTEAMAMVATATVPQILAALRGEPTSEAA